MADTSTFASPELDRAVQLCGELRREYLAVGGRRALTQSHRDRLIRLQSDLLTLAGSDALNVLLVDLRGAAAGKLTYARRHAALHGIRSDDPRWRTEVRLVLSERDSGTEGMLTERELTRLRDRSREALAAAKQASGRMANHPSASVATAQHALAGDSPVAELVTGLLTQQLVAAERTHAGGGLSRRQAQVRNRAVRRDLTILESAIVVLLNAKKNGRSAFDLSYAMAVGNLYAA